MSHNNYQTVPEGKDPVLWEIARKRASFRSHLVSYLIVNAFLWAIWFFTHQHYYSNDFDYLPWPVWPMLGWGVGLAFHYASAYIFPGVNLVENEYEKLKRRQTGDTKAV